MAITKKLLLSEQVRRDAELTIPAGDSFPAVKVERAGKPKYKGRIECGSTLQRACNNGGVVTRVYTEKD